MSTKVETVTVSKNEAELLRLLNWADEVEKRIDHYSQFGDRYKRTVESEIENVMYLHEGIDDLRAKIAKEKGETA